MAKELGKIDCNFGRKVASSNAGRSEEFQATVYQKTQGYAKIERWCIWPDTCPVPEG